MRFELVDRILEVVPGKSLRATKALTLAEEYLQDHFPTRPVMPGVIMVEAMVQACAWMVRIETKFAPTVVVLKEARAVRYGQFVRPGDQMVVDVELTKIGDGRAHFKGQAKVGDQIVVSGRLELEYFTLAERNPRNADVDATLRAEFQRRWEIVRPDSAGRSVDVPVV